MCIINLYNHLKYQFCTIPVDSGAIPVPFQCHSGGFRWFRCYSGAIPAELLDSGQNLWDTVKYWKSMITANYGLFSKDALESLMVAIYPSLHLLPSKVFIRIKKAFFHRTVFSYVTLTYFSHIFLQAGKVLQQIPGFGLMHWQKGFQHLKDCKCRISSLQGTSYPFSWCSLLSSGVGCCRWLVCVLSDIDLIYIYIYIFVNSPTNAKELFNLHHAQARNVIEH